MPSSSISTLPRWVVLKFGGTSVSTAARWRCIYSQIQSHLEDPQLHVWVTISAMTQVTNKLQRAIHLAASNRSKQESHLNIVREILHQHLILAYEMRLFSSIDSCSQLEFQTIFQHWTRAVFGSTSPSHLPTMSLEGNQPMLSEGIPDTFHPLLNTFQQLVRILEGIRLTEEASPRIQARVLSFGELLSTHLGLLILQSLGLYSDIIRVDARNVLFSPYDPSKSQEDTYLHAHIPPRTNVSLAMQWSQDKRVVLTQGFLAGLRDHTLTHFNSNPNSDPITCVLGRGGSDTSGALFAALLNAEKYEIWTDVHGMFTCDPRLLSEARLIHTLDYREAQELAAMGAKVLHPRCIDPVQFASVPIEIRNTNDPNGAKTVICSRVNHSAKILAVVRRENMTTLSITAFDMCGTSGFLSRVFAPFETFDISVDLIATSQFSVTVTLDHIPGGVHGEPFRNLVAALKVHGKIEVFEACSVVSIVGRKLRKRLCALWPVMRVLEGFDVLLLSESAEDLNLSFVLKQSDTNGVVAKMHQYFWDGDSEEIDNESLFGPSWGDLVEKCNSFKG